jgi:UDP-N-acetylmuramoyl-tripeptide--D-alanyl-D-alanine ligase
MIPMSLAEAAAIAGGRLDAGADPGTVITGPVVIDSRQASPGSVFAALPGTGADGHDFAPAAVAAGAVIAVVTRPVGAPALIVPDVPSALARLARAVVGRLPDLVIAGITGSAGKTTTKDLAAQLIERLGPTVAPCASFNNEIGHPLTVLRVTAATRYLVTELSARGPGHIKMLCEIAPPRLGVVLCVGNAHAGEFGGIDQVAAAKSELPAALPPDGAALLNADDRRVAAMVGCTPARVVSFGRSARAVVRARDVRLDDLGRPRFTLEMGGTAASVSLRLHGEHNVINALAAAALAGELGMSTGEAAQALSEATPRSRWRMEVTNRPDGVTVINDAYNASPEAMAAALEALAVIGRGRRRVAVLGHMAELGERSAEFHRQAGAQAARAGVDVLVAVGEQAAPLLAGAVAEPRWRGEAVQAADPRQAAETAVGLLRSGDVVLVKASRAAGLETVALELAGEAQR